MSTKYNQLAQNFIEGEWLYNSSDKTLKKMFASSDELNELKLIDKNGYLNLEFKAATIQVLGDVISNDVVGPFDDHDFFSGDIFEDITLYNLEIHQVSNNTLDALRKIQNVSIKNVD